MSNVEGFSPWSIDLITIIMEIIIINNCYILTSILCMYLRCFTPYNIHNNCTKGSQSRERHMVLLGK